jgi:glycosyltransferase involved in cell wall biosynthesis
LQTIPSVATEARPTLDVLIPHYDAPEGLAASLASVAAQDWTGDLRVIVADDGSDPAAFAAAEAAVARARDAGLGIVLLREPVNRGRPMTRNRLLDAAEAPWLAWLDAGDLWAPPKLRLQFEHVNRLRLAGEKVERFWITCNYDWRWTGAKARRVEQDVEGDQMRALLMGKSLRAYLWTLLAPTESFRRIGRFDEALPRLQDLDMFVRFVAAGGRIDKPPSRKPLCLYDKSDLGRDAREIRACAARVAAKHATFYARYGRAFERMRRYEAELHAARYALNNRRRWLMRLFLGRAFLAHPSLALREVATGRVRL